MPNTIVAKASSFMATHARVLDRRRFQRLEGAADPDALLAAVDAYRNPDGGYGWGLEPDLRSPESQTLTAMHAFEVYEDVAPATAQHAVALCDWLASVSLPDGGLPFVLPITDTAGCAPWFVGADSTTSSLQITAAVTAAAHRVAAHAPTVAAHPWLAQATGYCLAAIDAIGDTPHTLEVTCAVQFLDAVHDTRPEAPTLLRRLGGYIPASGLLHVQGGTEDEFIRPLDLAPYPDRPARTLFSRDVVAAELERLVEQQHEDGGWTVEFAKISPAGSLDWRGYATVRAVSILQRNSTI